MMDYKPILLGGATALIFVLLIFALATWIQTDVNKTILVTNITISGKICNDEIFGVVVSKVQDDNMSVYFIPNSDCNSYHIGEIISVSYNHICNLPVKEPGPLDGYCFNRIIGDYDD